MSVRDELIGKRFPVLDQGFVELRDVMGSDAAICEAARISYGKGTRKVSEDRDLIRYLYRHKHASPFEMAEIVLAIRMPMDVMRQMVRHRTASINEYSTRYSEAIDAMQVTPPDGWRLQSGANKQGSDGTVTDWPEGVAPTNMLGQPDFESPGHYLTAMEQYAQHKVRRVYEERLRFGVAREQARKDLPLSTYTEAYWKCDLRNVLGFLALRMDSHAQQEIRAYADIIGREIVAPLFPTTWEAFEDYTLNSFTLSPMDVEVITNIPAEGVEGALRLSFSNKREREECRVKLDRLNLIPESQA